MTDCILRGVVGSTVHGTGVEGQEDRDEMGIFIEYPERVCGTRALDHVIKRDKPAGVRSGPGDLDLVLYSLRKFCRLALGGNPSVLLLLFLPTYVEEHPLGTALLAERGAFYSRRAGDAFLGYLLSQRMALTGERSKKVSRPELVEQYGYDTKFAMHALRLGYQGLEYLRTSRISLPIPEPELGRLRAVRTGKVDFATVLEMIHETESALRSEAQKVTGEPDDQRVQRFLVAAHRRYWDEHSLW